MGSNDFEWGMKNSHNATAGTGPDQQSEFNLGTLVIHKLLLMQIPIYNNITSFVDM